MLTKIRDYEFSVNDFNARLAVSDNFVTNEKDLEEIARHRLNIQDSVGYREMLKIHNETFGFMGRNYSWVWKKYKRN